MKTKRVLKKIFNIILLFLLVGIAGCNSENANLSPARNIIGTWKTAMPIKFYIETNSCTGSFNLVATENREVTFIIKKGETENDVYVEVRFIGSDFTRTDFTYASCIGASTGYIPEVSPSFYNGTISGVNLTITNMGSFSFTTDNMMGTYDKSGVGVLRQRVYTETNQLKLYKE